MALQQRELFAGPETIGPQPRIWAKSVLPARFSTGTELLPLGAPVAMQTSDGKWVPYTQPSDAAVFTLTSLATTNGSDGGFATLYIDGLAIVLLWNETLANVNAKINAVLADAGKPYSVVATVPAMEAGLGVDAVVTLTFGEAAGAPSVSLDATTITDGGVSEPANLVLATVDAGTALNGTNLIRGFVYSQPIQLDSMDDVMGVVAVRGEAVAADVNTAAIRAVLRGSPSEGEVETALKEPDLNARILIRGLQGAV